MDASALVSAEYWLSWIATAKLFAAFLVAIGVAMEFGSEWISRPFEETVKHAREVQVRALENAAETARGDIAKAKTEAAKANERTAEVEERVAWRDLPDQTRAKLLNALAQSPSVALIAWTHNNPESMFFANQIVDVFKEANWGVFVQSWEYSDWLWFGTFIPPSPSDDSPVKAVRDAFTKAGLTYSEAEIPQPAFIRLNAPPQQPPVTVFIGSRNPHDPRDGGLRQ